MLAPDSDLLKDYMAKVGTYDLLSAEKERALLSVLKDPSMPSEERRKARDHLITSNLRLVMSIVKTYVHENINAMDLIQSGNIGLIDAIDRFDNTKGNRLSTYATWYIMLNVRTEYNRQIKAIKCPKSILTQYSKIRKIEKVFIQQNGHEPSAYETAEAMGEDTCFHHRQLEEAIRKLEQKAQESELSESEKQQLAWFKEDLMNYRAKMITSTKEAVLGRGISLDTPVQADTAASPGAMVSLVDTIVDPLQETPEDIAIRNVSAVEVMSLVDVTLNDKEKYIIMKRFGLNGLKPMTLGQLAETCNLSIERVKQIETRALEKMRIQAYAGDKSQIKDGDDDDDK